MEDFGSGELILEFQACVQSFRQPSEPTMDRAATLDSEVELGAEILGAVTFLFWHQ